MATFASAPGLDTQALQAVSVALSSTPRGLSFGRLTEPAIWLAGCQGQVPALRPDTPQVLVFAGENRVASHGISAYALEANQQLRQELSEGVGPIHALAHHAGASIRVHDCAPAGDISTEDAMDAPGLHAAYQTGENAADAAIDEGSGLVIPADLGVGDTTVAAAVMGVLTQTEPVAVVGPGSGITDEMWKIKVSTIRDAMFRARSMATSPYELMAVAGSPVLAALTGCIVRAAARRTPVLIDAPLPATAAVIAERLAPGTAAWCQAAGGGVEPAQRLALADLELIPFLELKTRGGQGLGALAALPLINAAVDLAAGEVAAVARGLSDPSSAER